MKYIFSLLFLIVGTPAFAKDPAGVDQILNKCISQQQFSRSCKFLPANAEKSREYQQTYLDKFVLQQWAKVGKKMNRLLESTGENPECGKPTANGEMTLESLTSTLVHASKSHNLSECQKACLALCASANALRYEVDDLAAPCSSFVKESGDCKAYSSLAEHFLKNIGIESRLAAVSDHEFISVKINNKWYHAEPQVDDCEFFEAK
jgi:hypothetical protein